MVSTTILGSFCWSLEVILIHSYVVPHVTACSVFSSFSLRKRMLKILFYNCFGCLAHFGHCRALNSLPSNYVGRLGCEAQPKWWHDMTPLGAPRWAITMAEDDGNPPVVSCQHFCGHLWPVIRRISRAGGLPFLVVRCFGIRQWMIMTSITRNSSTLQTSKPFPVIPLSFRLPFHSCTWEASRSKKTKTIRC